MQALRALTAGLATALVVPVLALPAAAADGAQAAGAPVVVASLVRTDDGGIEVERRRVATPAQGRSLAARLRAEPDVVDAALDGVVTASALPTVDPLQPKQWGLPAVKAPEAWTAGDATGQLIAVVDSGVDLTHPDFSGVLAGGHDYVEDDSVPDDDNGHGTHVAGIAGAVAGNDKGGAGVGLRTRILPIKVLDANGSGSTADVAAAIHLALESGATVINLSLGGDNESSMVKNAVETALANGVPVVAAAGNQGHSTPSYPAAQPGVLAVGAVDSKLALAPFSNTGSHLALVGPGVSVLSTTRRTDTDTSGYGYMSGTSMATPFVAGTLALLRAAAPTADLAQLRSALVSTAADLGQAGRDPLYGAGLVDAAAAREQLVPTADTTTDTTATDTATTDTTTTDTTTTDTTTTDDTASEPTTDTNTDTTTSEPVTSDPVAVEEPVATEPVADEPVVQEPVAGPTDVTSSPTARGLDAACPVGSVPPNPFTDVRTGSTHERAISCLVWWEVANGKSLTSYAPASSVTREEMAAFVARAVLAARPGSLPASPSNAFGDDDASVHRLSIDRLAAVGIVGGTGAGTYSPKAVVTRGQMARFLANAAAHVLGAPLPVQRDLFSDDAGSLFEADINRVAQAGLTGGYADGTYRPGGTVLRDQMGSFLARTLDLFVVQAGAVLPR